MYLHIFINSNAGCGVVNHVHLPETKEKINLNKDNGNTFKPEL
jgi:hypothetical protein